MNNEIKSFVGVCEIEDDNGNDIILQGVYEVSFTDDSDNITINFLPEDKKYSYISENELGSDFLYEKHEEFTDWFKTHQQKIINNLLPKQSKDNIIRQRIALKNQLIDAEQEVKNIKSALADLDSAITLQWLQEGKTSETVDGVNVAFVSSTYVSPKAGCEADLYHYFENTDSAVCLETVSKKGLSEWVKQLPVDEETGQHILPPQIQDAVNIYEKTVLRQTNKKG